MVASNTNEDGVSSVVELIAAYTLEADNSREWTVGEQYKSRADSLKTALRLLAGLTDTEIDTLVEARLDELNRGDS